MPNATKEETRNGQQDAAPAKFSLTLKKRPILASFLLILRGDFAAYSRLRQQLSSRFSRPRNFLLFFSARDDALTRGMRDYNCHYMPSFMQYPFVDDTALRFIHYTYWRHAYPLGLQLFHALMR